MILVRVVFQARHGKAGELVAGMKKAIEQMGRGDEPAKGRLLTDLSGPLDTAVLETEHASLAAWEQFRARMFTTPEYQESGPRAEEVILSGYQEYYTIEAES